MSFTDTRHLCAAGRELVVDTGGDRKHHWLHTDDGSICLHPFVPPRGEEETYHCANCGERFGYATWMAKDLRSLRSLLSDREQRIRELEGERRDLEWSNGRLTARVESLLAAERQLEERVTIAEGEVAEGKKDRERMDWLVQHGARREDIDAARSSFPADTGVDSEAHDADG